MKITLRKESQAGNNCVATLRFDDRIVTPQGMHMSPAEFDELTIVMSQGAAGLSEVEFEVDDR